MLIYLKDGWRIIGKWISIEYRNYLIIGLRLK